MPARCVTDSVSERAATAAKTVTDTADEGDDAIEPRADCGLVVLGLSCLASQIYCVYGGEEICRNTNKTF